MVCVFAGWKRDVCKFMFCNWAIIYITFAVADSVWRETIFVESCIPRTVANSFYTGKLPADKRIVSRQNVMDRHSIKRVIKNLFHLFSSIIYSNTIFLSQQLKSLFRTIGILCLKPTIQYHRWQLVQICYNAVFCTATSFNFS